VIHRVVVENFPALLTFYIYIAKIIEMPVLIDWYRPVVRQQPCGSPWTLIMTLATDLALLQPGVGSGGIFRPARYEISGNPHVIQS
jgi:hypothetical protein